MAQNLQPGDIIQWPPSVEQWVVTESRPDVSRPDSAGTWRLVAEQLTNIPPEIGAIVKAADVAIDDEFPVMGWVE